MRFAVVLALLIAAGPASAQAEPEDVEPSVSVPMPYEAPRTSSPHALPSAFLVAGVTLIVVGYVANVVTAFAPIITIEGPFPTGLDPALYFGCSVIPVAGAFVSAGLIHDLTGYAVAHVIEGVVELAGWALLIAGFVAEHDVITAGRREGTMTGDWSITPWSGPSGAGARFEIEL
jgi:hypothetical protein